ncbi:MAG: hypothetical protein IPM12_02750 [Flavobacteriales bacterium]|nr:hypothetical protein [Flavobacteriales bacterium]
MRPSWTTMVAEESGEREKKVLEPFKTLGITSKFNDHGIGVPAVNASGGDNAARDASLQRFISAHGPAIVGKWFNRDAEGGMDTKLIQERGRYSQDDMDRMIQLHSQVDRSGAQGWQLLDLTYVVVYDVTKVEYRRDAVKTTDKKSGSSKASNFLDALNKAASANAPSTPSGSSSTKYVDVYRIEYTADLYKLQWNDSVEWQFVQRFWNPREAPDAAKAAVWNEASFPLTKVASFKDYLTERENVNQSDPPHEEILAKFASRMQKQAVERCSKKVSELRPRAPVVEAYPLTARLGTKEDVKVNDRFVAFEYKQGRKGYSMKRKGVVRAYKVTRNQTDADGRTKPSTFQQQGGWKVWPGMSIEERHDLGVNISGGYVMGNAISTGISGTVKWNGLGTLTRFPNFYIGGFFNNYFGSSLDASGLVGSIGRDPKPGEWSGNGTDIGFLLSKEFYLMNRGNLYVEPTLGYGLATWHFTNNGSEAISNKSDKDALSYKYRRINLGCGVGHHLGPFLALELRPSIGLTTKFEYDNESGGAILRTNVELSDEAQELTKSFKSGIVPSVLVALKVRF